MLVNSNNRLAALDNGHHHHCMSSEIVDITVATTILCGHRDKSATQPNKNVEPHHNILIYTHSYTHSYTHTHIKYRDDNFQSIFCISFFCVKYIGELEWILPIDIVFLYVYDIDIVNVSVYFECAYCMNRTYYTCVRNVHIYLFILNQTKPNSYKCLCAKYTKIYYSTIIYYTIQYTTCINNFFFFAFNRSDVFRGYEPMNIGGKY